MAKIGDAFSTPAGISLNDLVGIFEGSGDPSSVGEVAPKGSLYLRYGGTNGELWIKTGTGNSDWSRVGIIPEIDSLWFGATRSTNLTNSYLRHHNNVPTNISPIILPFDATLMAMSCSTQSNETCTFQIRLNGTAVTGANISLSSASSNYSSSYSIDFNAGDGIQFYCSGSNINRPTCYAFFRRR